MCTPPTLGRPRLLVLPGLKATTCLTVVLLVCLETVLLSTSSNCAKTFYMHWNTTNSIFRIDNTDHIIDVNKGNMDFEYDQVHIICPGYEPGTFDNETEKYIIYNVSKVEYETCRITNADPRIIAVCDQPQKLLYFTITFRPFTPQPGGLEFLPGNDYYFISTSSKDDLHRRIGGRCSTNNMKVVFKVCCAAPTVRPELAGPPSSSVTSIGHEPSGSPAHNGHHGASTSVNTALGPSLHGTSSASSPAVNGGMTGITINTQIDQPGRINTPHDAVQTPGTSGSSGAVWPRWGQSGQTSLANGGGAAAPGDYPYLYPPPPAAGRPFGAKPSANEATTGHSNHSNYGPSNKPTKKTSEYDKHPNEVVKNEELTYNSAAVRPASASLVQLAIVCLAAVWLLGVASPAVGWPLAVGRSSAVPLQRSTGDRPVMDSATPLSRTEQQQRPRTR